MTHEPMEVNSPDQASPDSPDEDQFNQIHQPSKPKKDLHRCTMSGSVGIKGPTCYFSW